MRPAKAPRRSVSSTTRTWASGGAALMCAPGERTPGRRVAGLLPARDLVPAVGEALVHVVHVHVARTVRSADQRPQDAADEPRDGARRRALSGVAPDRAACSTRRGARDRAHAGALRDLPALASSRRRPGLIGERLARGDVTIRTALTHLLVLLVAVENRSRRRTSGDERRHEDSRHLTRHEACLMPSAAQKQGALPPPPAAWYWAPPWSSTTRASGSILRSRGTTSVPAPRGAGSMPCRPSSSSHPRW